MSINNLTKFLMAWLRALLACLNCILLVLSYK